MTARRLAAALGVVAVFTLGVGPAAHAADPTPTPAPTSEGPKLADRAKDAARNTVINMLPGVAAIQSIRGIAEGAQKIADTPAGQAVTETVMGDRCKILPTIGTPTDGLAGRINPGPSRPGAGLYSVYGWGGYVPTMHEPGCPIGIDLSMTGAQKRVYDGNNDAAARIMQTQVSLLAAGTQAASVVLEPQDGVWAPLTPWTSFLRWTMGWRAWIAFGTVAVGATSLWFAFRAHRGDVTEARRTSGRAAVILSVGAGVLLTTVTVGSLVSQGVSVVYQTMSTGTSESAQQPGASADAAIGDVLAQHVAWPTWVDVHFGQDTAAADRFATRMFAAANMTRAEYAQAAADPAYHQQLVQRKNADYLQVAREYKAMYPATYEATLAGGDTSQRPWKALLGLVGALPAAVFLLWTLWWVGAARLIVELAVAVTPIVALITHYPTLQDRAYSAARWVATFLTTAAAAVGVYVAFTVGVIGGILSAPSLSTTAKFVWMIAILLACRWAWRKARRRLYAATGVAQSTRSLLGVLRAILAELRLSRSGLGRQEAGRQTASAGEPRAAAAGSVEEGEAQRPRVRPRRAPRTIPDTTDTQPRHEQPRQTTEPGPRMPRFRRLPDPVDATSPGYAPRINRVPPSSADLTDQVRAERARLVRLLASRAVQKETVNVHVAR